ncbi:MAG: hypothetical protein IT197_02350 [Acidimicrobiia bacterium]|nr:hypothetical protein [Acidimicrobiia bacterium]
MGRMARSGPRRSLLASAGALLAVLGTAGVAAAAPTPWEVAEVSPSGDLADSPRAFAAVSTLGAGDSTVLFGGLLPPTDDALGDTLIFDGEQWQRVCGDPDAVPADPCGPDARVAGGLADTPTGAVLYGGEENLGNLGLTDQWSFDASTGEWTAVCGTGALPACAPGARGMHAMAGHGGRVVMFGGLGAAGPLGDTWVSSDSGATWTQVCGGPSQPACGPAARIGASMAWDGARFVLFGGGAPDDPPTLFTDTWTFDGAKWTPVCGTGALPACGPGGRILPGFSGVGYGKADQPRALLAGGLEMWDDDDDMTLFRDAWLWDGAGWTAQAVPWDSAAVTFAGEDFPPPGPDPLVAVAGGVDCRVVVTGAVVEDLPGGPGFGSQRTFLAGEDPAGCPTTPPPAAAPATAVPTAQLAYTGRSSTPVALAGLTALLAGAALAAASRQRPRPVARRPDAGPG